MTMIASGADDAHHSGDEHEREEFLPPFEGGAATDALESSVPQGDTEAPTMSGAQAGATSSPMRPNTHRKRVTAPRWESKGATPSEPRTATPEQAQKERELLLLWIAYKTTGHQELRERLTEHYQPLVKMLAERMAARLHSSVTVEELISSGNLGLMDAIDGFDPEKGVKFETYCTQRVQGAMLDDLRQMDWAPRHVRYCQAMYEGAQEELETRLGRPPSDIEMMEQLGLSCEEYHELKKKAQPSTMTSLSQFTSSGGNEDDEEGLTRLDVLANDHSPSPAMNLSECDALRTVLSTLASKERMIFVLYHCEQLTMKQIGDVFHVSESRVSQINSDVLKRLQDLIEERGTDLLG